MTCLLKRNLRHLYVAALLTYSCLMAYAEVTNDIPAWLALPSLVWGEETNGVRAGVTDGDPGVKGVVVFVAGPGTNSVILGPGTNKNWRYVAPPYVKFAKVELRATNGIMLFPLEGKKLDGTLPQQYQLKDLPRSPERGTRERGSGGGLRNWLIGNPATLQVFSIQDSYLIEKEGDYILSVYPVIYQYAPDRPFVSRLDLPCVTTKIHLAP